MSSDWRVVDEPLARFACDTCGLAHRRSTSDRGESLYASGYSLYAHSPGGAYERARQELYAGWIVEAVGSPPASVLDVGCGNGSLLQALSRRWPHATLQGCDPSAESIAHGSGSGLKLWQGTARDIPAGAAFDLVISVNVIEHAPDPAGFLRALHDVLTPHGVLVLVCPDGSKPGLELLFNDHLFSFAPAHLETLCAREHLAVVSQSIAPAALGEFQMVVARPTHAPVSIPVAVASNPVARRCYLESWRQLDARLLTRVQASVVCFGAGEAAGLLRAYAPDTWQRVRACTVDDASDGAFGDRPLIAIDDVKPEETVLVGVRPTDQSRVAARLRERFTHVVTWYDLI
jgi:2-polyprenyl-3-methyl-5-hydroxy-6-metoxy-1,4-benzoquinol methylase